MQLADSQNVGIAICGFPKNASGVLIEHLLFRHKYLPTTPGRLDEGSRVDELPVTALGNRVIQHNSHWQRVIRPVPHMICIRSVPPAISRGLTEPTDAALDLQRKQSSFNYVIVDYLDLRVDAKILGRLFSKQPAEFAFDRELGLSHPNGGGLG